MQDCSKPRAPNGLHLSDAKTSKKLSFCILKQLVCISLYIKKKKKTRKEKKKKKNSSKVS